MDKLYLNKLALLILFVLTLFATPVLAEDSYSHLFITITDATRALKTGDRKVAEQLIAQLQLDFTQIENHDSKAGQLVTSRLAKLENTPTEENLVAVSKALLDFEVEQHPVDVAAEKEKLMMKLVPSYDRLQEAIDSQDIDAVKEQYKKLNSTWTINERIVRDTSTSHYGKIETAISFLRSSIEATPVEYSLVQTSFDDLKNAIQNFKDGKEVATIATNLTLQDGIELLEQARAAFAAEDKSKGAALMKEFITIWPSIEGDVSTRRPSLYTRVESESPVIMVRGEEKEYQEKLAQLIADLSSIDTSASYNVFDAMLILLREGVEALLIVMALVSTLKASKQKKGLVWVYSGAVGGLLASALLAIALQQFFPTLSSAANREIIEGAVGIVAVVMMIVIGIWLHSKSSSKKWNAYMERQMRMVMASGSFISMFALSFLAVFREGAETILFYAGMLPKIGFDEFLLGIGLAFLVLIILAVLMLRTTSKIKPNRVFFYLTWLLYALAFKMLGVSIHALELMNILPTHVIKEVPTVEIIGLYPSLVVLLPQILLIALIGWLTWKNRETHED
ncbi:MULTISPECIES: FTR1 family protein [unclassified Streptococcus]|uniref:FTR1 family iron permease n=1 Tax=unclassified Streptococcus TaxID=2608887 RepID=UPI0010728EF9|nr:MULTISPECIES: FTR1 family protein [unclassified Streptococcus]MBF0787377.1 FTR1 family iron permease [Streptococcus sp. 19428wC2_LYSM12]MCQ9211084.1 FTR1 family iron permease [Streptococcus sp. B01]MCQ9214359.1 FTR1 family iron permease [Streptococcus sp. O1]TFV05720.1 FTR1 family iron permease [Streptococcus sp. LYSM12]